MDRENKKQNFAVEKYANGSLGNNVCCIELAKD
jgi:hypothetical protein